MKNVDIYGTIGPACAKPEILRQMFELGMTGMRMNLSHMGLAAGAEWIERIHRAAEEASVSAKLLIDLQGPELRMGDVETRLIEEDELLLLGAGGIPVPAVIFDGMNAGQRILIDDGKIELEVEQILDLQARCVVKRGGILHARKSIALPGMTIHSETLTEQDRLNLSQAQKYQVSHVMLPFARDAQDIKNLREELQKNHLNQVKILAKIENLEGVEHLDEFLNLADEIVIARGDLGNAVPLWKLPILQKEISMKCCDAGVPFMVVTQMLASMEHAKVPTRAEVSDICNAVLDGAGSVMVTGETASGEYPVQVMEYLTETVHEAAKYAAGKERRGEKEACIEF